MSKERFPFFVFVTFHAVTIILLVYYFTNMSASSTRPIRYLKHEREEQARQQHPPETLRSQQQYQDFHTLLVSRNNRTKPHVTIPRIIHQIWNDVYIPREFVENIHGLVRHNKPPAWQYYLWTMSSARAFITDKYPQYLHLYLTLEDNITRSDFIRYLVLYEYGGVYFDLDTVSVKSLDHFVDSHGCSFVNEPLEHTSLLYNMPILLTNAAMLCRQKHPFIRSILDTLESYRHVTKCVGAFQCTGPLALTRLFLYNTRVRLEQYDIDIAPTEYFQSIYDEDVLKEKMTFLCKNLPKLVGDQNEACSRLKTRAHTQNAPSSEAYTYHTWYHIASRGVTVNSQNHIKSIVPHVKLYVSD